MADRGRDAVMELTGRRWERKERFQERLTKMGSLHVPASLTL